MKNNKYQLFGFLLIIIVFCFTCKADAKILVASNDYFSAQTGTYWVYEGSGSILENDKLVYYKIKFKNEVISIEVIDNGYLLKVKTTDLISGSVGAGIITLRNNFVDFNFKQPNNFNNYVKFPLKVGNRWAESLESDPAEKLRDDGFYQNRINWKLRGKVLGNNCYNVIQQTLPDKVETIWCDKIGPIQTSYHHNGSLNNTLIRLVRFHY